MLNSEVKKRINDLHDILVGQLPLPSERLELITVSLIYKFMEDMDNKAKKIGGKPSFFVKSLAKSSWSSVLNYKPTAKENAATKLVENFSTAIRSIAKAEHIPDFFRSIFNNVSIRITNGKILKSFMDEISKFEYIHSEELGNAFEHLLKTVGNQKENGAFRTPRNIIHFIVNVVDPQKSDSILDPACGTGGFLIEAATHIKRHNTSPQYKKDPNKWGDLLKSWKGKLSENIQGYDNTPLMVRLSKVNMFLHQLTDPQIHEYDTISSYTRWNDKFDVILANPPFMTPKGGVKAHDKFKIQAKKAEVLFSDYILEHLKPGGRAGIIVPEGIIANSSNNDFVDLRKWAIKEMGLWAVVSLPANIFQPYSGVKTSILFIDRSSTKTKREIILLKVENDGYSLNTNRNPIKEDDLPEADEILMHFKEGKSLNSRQWKVKFNIIPKDDFDKLDAYRASTTAWNVCRKAWERLDKTVADLNVKLSDNKEKHPTYEEQYLKAIDNFKEITGISFKAIKPGKGVFANPLSKDEIKELFDEQVKEDVIKFGNLEQTKKLSDIIVQSLINERHYNLSFDRKDIQSLVEGDVPLMRLEDVCTMVRGPFGGSLKKEIFVDAGYKVYEQSHAIKNDFSIGRYYITQEKFNEMKRFALAPGDLIMSCSGTMGKVAVFPTNADKGIINQALLRIIPNREIILPEYLKFVMDSDTFQQRLLNGSTGVAISNVVSVSEIKSFEIPVPSIEKQQEILSELNSYKKIVDGVTAIIENYTPLFTISREWDVKKMGEICDDFKNGVNFSKEQVGKGVPFVNVSDIFSYNGFVNNSNLELVDISNKEIERFSLKHNDLVFVRSSVKEQGVGFVSLINKTEDEQPLVFCGFVIKCSPDTSQVNPQFLLYLLRTEEYRLKIIAQSSRATITNISQTAIQDLDIFLPPLELQNEIVAQVNDEYKTIARCRKLKAKTQAKIKQLVNSLWGVPAEEGEMVEA
jgi:type I restriction-modification system DNA methylase subunit/restriction endonuclease S subunit